MMVELVEPFRLRVQKRITSRLEEVITTLDSIPLVDRVFRGRIVFGDDDPLPMLSLLEEPIAEDQVDSPLGGAASTGLYRLVLQGFVDDDPKHPTDPAHFLMADCKAKLAEIKLEEHQRNRVFSFGPKAPTVMKIEFGAGVVRPPDELSARAYFWLTIELGLVEDHDAPYA